MHTVPVGATLSLTQLAAGLNVVYFTFRDINLTYFSKYNFLEDDLESSLKDGIGDHNSDLANRIQRFLRTFRQFQAGVDSPFATTENVLFFIGYIDFFVCCTILIISTIWSASSVHWPFFWLMLIVEYAPITTSITIELYLRFIFLPLKKQAFSLKEQVLTELTRTTSSTEGALQK